ncbi:exodeoxyribonuclease VII large subunit [Virgibacillus halophilus]|uniref:Exodeoxyribonuclease VII large subunit n=1 Tax=Tigheibacillus halophilus TaxID=361280 RepID=A0ABU5CB82_9BACI|nr:exodeoxyribonuclease VII large subunit [Virgibacillus halophilus]
MLDKQSEKVAQLKNRLLSVHPAKQINQASREMTFLNKRLQQTMTRRLEQKKAALHTLIEKLTVLNPLETMRRGFSITYTEKGNILKAKNDVAKNDRITVKISDARLDCRVLDIRED